MSELSKKRYKSYDKISRYSVFPYYYNDVDDKYMYGLTAQLDKEETPYVIHTVVKGDTLDSIALYYTNIPTLYWVIADFNNIQDPFQPLKIGTRLKIPTLSKIKFNL